MRFFRPMVEQFLILASYGKHHTGESLQTMAERVRYVSGGPLANARKRLDKGATLDALIKHLDKALDEDLREIGERDLIDTIITTLQLPYTKNVLSGESIRRLRDAVLLPSEIGGLVHRLSQRELSCANCGLPLHDRESVTLILAPSGPTFTCHRCVAPTCVSCSGCAESAELSQKATVAMSRMQCLECQAKKAGKLPTAPSLDPMEPINLGTRATISRITGQTTRTIPWNFNGQDEAAAPPTSAFENLRVATRTGEQ